MRVFFTRHLSLPRELNGGVQYRMAMSWQRVDSPDKVQPWFLRDSPGFEIVPELKPLPAKGILDKITMSAFEGTLSRWLSVTAPSARSPSPGSRWSRIEPTRDMPADLGFIPVVVGDACGSGHRGRGAPVGGALEFAGDAIITTPQRAATTSAA